MKLLGPMVAVGVGGALVISVLGGSSDTFGPIVIVVFVAGFSFLSFRFAGRLTRGFSGQDVIERDEPASAVIVSMAETGMTVNQQPMVSFELSVTASDGSTFEETVDQSHEAVSHHDFLARAVSATGEIDSMSETGQSATEPERTPLTHG